MRVAAWVNGYPPNLMTGASLMMHEILLGLKNRGHEVCVYSLNTASQPFEGVDVVALRGGVEQQCHEWADIVLTQTSATHTTSHHFANRKPIVYINHDPKEYAHEVPRSARSLLVVFNSEYGAQTIKTDRPSIVVPPPVHPDRYKTSRGEAITLVNLNKNKGGDIFWQLVLALPSHKFLGVKGGYGHQILSRQLPSNVEIIDPTPDMRSVYSKTRILIVPSIVESYGRVAIEAFASGIPVVSSMTDGLQEAVSEAGIFVKSRRVEDWVAEIIKLDNPDVYASASDKALTRSHELDPSSSFERLDQAMCDLVKTFHQM